MAVFAESNLQLREMGLHLYMGGGLFNCTDILISTIDYFKCLANIILGTTDLYLQTHRHNDCL
jgi:hypothetical protein